jgi:oxygen-independent coproporphyrinogen-3 oxidase
MPQPQHDLQKRDLQKHLDRRIPRYTSYPTAVQFGPQVDARLYQRWLGALPAGTAVSIYLHVPFCAELCLYCGCNTTVARRYEPVAAYVELLEREIALVGGNLTDPVVTHIHWGGGTPTMLQPRDFARVMAALRKSFTIAPDAEIAVEIDPRTLARGQAEVLADLGTTRASLGVQDFDARVQQAVRRVQSFEQTARVAEWLRGVGINAINLDLIYGLPLQTVATVTATARRALALDPDRIALFGYAHVPWMKRHQKLLPEEALPGNAERFAQNRAAAETFAAAGYRRIGLDHFAKDDDLLVRRQREGRLHRNFQGYTTDESPILLGFGPSAIGALPGGYVQNAPGMPAYREVIAGGGFATARGCQLTAEDRLRAAVIARLMCDLSVDLAAVCRAHGTDPAHFAAELAAIDALTDDGIVERDGDTITVPDHARVFVRAVCAVFDAYLGVGETRFSRAS